MTARVPLVPAGMLEDTLAARHFGAYLLGRAIAHGDDIDETISTGTQIISAALALGFTAAEANSAVIAYRELLGG